MINVLDVPWRVGSQVGRTLYINPPGEGKHPSFLIGMMDSPELAQHIVNLHNNWLENGE